LHKASSSYVALLVENLVETIEEYQTLSAFESRLEKILWIALQEFSRHDSSIWIGNFVD
jgi:hypothetical protein